VPRTRRDGAEGCSVGPAGAGAGTRVCYTLALCRSPFNTSRDHVPIGSAPSLANGIQDSVYYSMDLKPLAFVGNSREELRSFPVDARRRAGFELDQVQRGLLPTDWKPMTSIGSGVLEIRIHTGVEHRVFYVAKFQEAVYVLHAFEKKREKTSKRDIELGRARLSELLVQRRQIQE